MWVMCMSSAVRNAASQARKPGGLLGAEFSRDDSGYFRIERIFAGENWDAANRSPLTESWRERQTR